MTPSTWAVAALLWLLIGFPAAAQIVGPARIIDGDSIEVSGQRIRLWGIDAPERAQTCESLTEIWTSDPPRPKTHECGRDASAALAAILRDRSVSCEPRDRDRYGRTVATCSTETGDVGAEMVRQGWAIDYEKYSMGRYAAEEAEARNAKRGIWARRFEMPEDWRRQHKVEHGHNR